jgi:polysaccharide export outer membrane protein
MKLQTKLIVFSAIFLMLQAVATAEPDLPEITQTLNAVEIQPRTSNFDPLTYTLGPDDAIEISVMRHPEFSGTYPINQEGKIQYKFVGDMEVNGLTKAELEQRIRDVLSTYVKNPEVNITVTDYRSKYFYVLGEVGTPGKYYMRSETMSVREAVFEAGLPTVSAAMRKCRLISPSFRGNGKVRGVDLYAILYGGNLKKNINMHPGDVLYVPSTVMAKLIRVINPVTTTVGLAASGPDSASTGRTATGTLRGKPY